MKDIWLSSYKLAKEYYEENGNLLIPSNYVVKDKNNKDFPLGMWIIRQRIFYNNIEKYNYEKDKIDLLNDIGMVWSVYRNKDLTDSHWICVYNWIKNYYEENGNLKIPTKLNITLSNNTTVSPYAWLLRQKSFYRENNLNEEQIRLLDELNISYEKTNLKGYISDGWMKKYELAKKYYEKHGNLIIKSNYKVLVDGEEIFLGTWILNQRRAYSAKNISDKKVDLLNEIGMIWNAKTDDNIDYLTFNIKYNKLKECYSLFGDINNIPNETKEYRELNYWVYKQKMLHNAGNLEEYKIKLLESLNIIWNKLEDENYISPSFMKKYNLAKKFYQEHGNLFVSSNLVVKDGDNYINLGYWICNLRRKKKEGSLSKIKIDLLDDIDMVWEDVSNKRLEEKEKNPEFIDNKKKFNSKYKLAKMYFDEHHDLNIPNDYYIKSDTGKDVKLSSWMNYLRTLYKKNKLDEKQIKMLNEIDMIWDKKEYEKISKRIDEIYEAYLNDYYNKNQIDCYIKKGILKYSDDGHFILKGNPNKVLK